MIMNVPEQLLRRPNKLGGWRCGGVGGGQEQDLLSLHLDLMAGDVSKDTLHICFIYLTFL